MSKSLGLSDREYLEAIIKDPQASAQLKQKAQSLLKSNDSGFFNQFLLRDMPGYKDYTHPYNRQHFIPPRKTAGFYNPQNRGGYHGVYNNPTPPAKPPKPGFVLHKQGSISIGEQIPALPVLTRDPYEGLDEVVAQATGQQASPGWGDIAQINQLTGKPEGGADSYYEAPAPDNSDLGMPSPGKKKVRIKSRATIQDNLWQKAFYEKLVKQTSNWGAAAERMSEASTSIAYSGRFKLAQELKRFDSVQARKDYLNAAGIDPEAAYGHQLMLLAEILHVRDTGKSTYHQTGIGDISNLSPERLPMTSLDPSKLWWESRKYSSDIGFYVPGKGQFRAKGIGGKYSGGTWHIGGQSAVGFDYSGNTYTRGGIPFYGYSHLEDAPKEQVKKFDWEKLLSNLKKFSDGIENVAPIITNMGQASKAWQKETTAQLNGIYEASEYFVPKPFRGATSRLFQAGSLAMNSRWTKVTSGLTAAGQGLGALAQLGVGAATMNPGLIASGVASGVKAVGAYGQGRIKSWGEDIRSRINLWSGVAELVIAPFRLLANAARTLWSHFSRLSLKLVDVVSQFNSLGLPLTMLTGVSYADMQRSYAADSMIGARKGATNSSIESFTGAQMDLFTLGKLDEQRLVASAMLGQFSNVYAFGGDPQEQYAATINGIYKQLQSAPDERSKQRIMNLAGKIDSTLPARLQQMRNLTLLGGQWEGASDYRNFMGKSPTWLQWSGIHQYTATEPQRARYTKAGMEVTALKESIGESRNVIAERLWSSIGKPAMSAVNDIFHQLAEGGSWKQAAESAKKAVKQLWSNIAKQFDLPDNLEEAWGKIKDMLMRGLAKILPYIGDALAQITSLIIKGWTELIVKLQPLINTALAELGSIRLNVDAKKFPLFLAGKASLDAVISAQTPWSVKRDYENKWRSASSNEAERWASRTKNPNYADAKIASDPIAKLLLGTPDTLTPEQITQIRSMSDDDLQNAWHNAARTAMLLNYSSLQDMLDDRKKDLPFGAYRHFAGEGYAWDKEKGGPFTAESAEYLHQQGFGIADAAGTTIRDMFTDVSNTLTIRLENKDKKAAEAVIDKKTNSVQSVRIYDLENVQRSEGNTLTVYESGIGM